MGEPYDLLMDVTGDLMKLGGQWAGHPTTEKPSRPFSPNVEAAFMASDVLEMLKKNLSPKEMANAMRELKDKIVSKHIPGFVRMSAKLDSAIQKLEARTLRKRPHSGEMTEERPPKRVKRQ